MSVWSESDPDESLEEENLHCVSTDGLQSLALHQQGGATRQRFLIKWPYIYLFYFFSSEGHGAFGEALNSPQHDFILSFVC